MGSLDIATPPYKSTSQADEEACLYSLQLASSCILPMTLKAAIELDMLEILVQGCGGPSGKPLMTATGVTSRLNTHNPQAEAMVDRMLRLLATYNVVECAVELGDDGKSVIRRYGPAAVCKWLTKDKDGFSIAPLLLMNQDKILMESWYYLKDTVMEGGIPFNKAYGMTAFEYNAKSPRLNRLFNEGMKSHSIVFTKSFLEIYQGFGDIETLHYIKLALSQQDIATQGLIGCIRPGVLLRICFVALKSLYCNQLMLIASDSSGSPTLICRYEING